MKKYLVKLICNTVEIDYMEVYEKNVTSVETYAKKRFKNAYPQYFDKGYIAIIEL